MSRSNSNTTLRLDLGHAWLALVAWLLIAGLPASAQQPPETPATVSGLVEQGREALSKGNPQHARRVLEEAVSREPKSAEAWSLLADSYAQLGWNEKAIAAYQTVLKLRPHSANALHNLGLLSWRGKRCEDAVRYLEGFQEQEPQDHTVLVALADCRFQLGLTPQAQRDVQEMIRAAGDSADANFQAGRLLLHHRQIEAALVPLARAMTLRPDWDEPRLRLAVAESLLNHPARVAELLRGHLMPRAPLYSQILGVALVQLGQYQEAIPLLEESVRGETADAAVYQHLAAAYAGTSQEQRALEILQEARRHWPEDEAIRTALIQHLSHLKDPAEALTLLRKRENQELLPEDLVLLASCYVSLHQPEEAARLARRAVDEGGGEPALLALANILQMQGRDLEVIEVLEAHKTQFSTSAKYAFTLGVSYYNNGSYARASELFKRAARLDPSLAQAHYFEGNALARLGMPELAVAQYQEAIRLAPENALYYFHLGQVHSSLGEKARAEEALRRSVQLNGSYAQARYELAKIYFETSREEAAREQLELAIQSDPNTDGSYYLLSQVYARLGRREDAQRTLGQFQAIKRQRQEEQRALIQKSAERQKP